MFISLALVDRHALGMLEKISLAVSVASILVMAVARDLENGLAVLQFEAGGHFLHRDSLVRTMRKMAERTLVDKSLY
jgi:hypothetical protein